MIQGRGLRIVWLLVVTASAGCSAGDREATGKLTGICKLQVIPGPPGAKHPSPEPYPGAKVTVYDAGGQQVAEATADAEGKFHLTLPPGHYRLVPAKSQPKPRPTSSIYPAVEREVQITRGGVTEVDFVFHDPHP
jgi:hypothetical protein